MLYHSLVYNKIQYGIIVWGTANKTLQEYIRVKLDYTLRMSLLCNIYTPVSHLYRFLTFLKLEDICELELSKFMHQLYNNNLVAFFVSALQKLILCTTIKSDCAAVLWRIFYRE